MILSYDYTADDALLDWLDDRIDPTSSQEELEKQIEDALNSFSRRTRKRKDRDGAYHTCRYWGDKVGRSANTIRKEFLKEREGVIRKTYSGRNRKTCTVMLISKTAIKRHYPDAEI